MIKWILKGMFKSLSPNSSEGRKVRIAKLEEETGRSYDECAAIVYERDIARGFPITDDELADIQRITSKGQEGCSVARSVGFKIMRILALGLGIYLGYLGISYLVFFIGASANGVDVPAIGFIVPSLLLTGFGLCLLLWRKLRRLAPFFAKEVKIDG